jgi:Lamin Tail Domain
MADPTRWLASGCTWLLIFALGCGDDENLPTGTSSAGAAGGAGGGAGPASIEGLAINEISASGADWIELYNAGTNGIDLSGLAIADEEGGIPKYDEAVELPANTTVEPSSFFFVLADQEHASTTVEESCAPGPAPCIYTPWGLSAQDGERVFLLRSAEANAEVLLQERLPAGAIVEGQAWGRVPDGTGDFVVTVPTPGAVNQTAQ